MTGMVEAKTTYRCEGSCRETKEACEMIGGGECRISQHCPGTKEDGYKSLWRWDRCRSKQVLGAATEKVLGDVDGDGWVTKDDWKQWQKEFNGEIAMVRGDSDKDGETTLRDFELWRREWEGGGEKENGELAWGGVEIEEEE